MARSWESSPWKWVAVVVVATVVGGVITAAIQKWTGLKLAQKAQQELTLVSAQALAQTVSAPKRASNCASCRYQTVF